MTAIRDRVKGLTVLVEPSDNIGAGAPGDCTGCLRALIDHQIEESAVCLNDPKSVVALSDCRPGQKRTLSLGGKGANSTTAPSRWRWNSFHAVMAGSSWRTNKAIWPRWLGITPRWARVQSFAMAALPYC